MTGTADEIADDEEILERFSPIKMVGLFRPSTVYEENSRENSRASAAQMDSLAAANNAYDSELTSGETVVRQLSSNTTGISVMSTDSIELPSVAAASSISGSVDFSRDSLLVSERIDEEGASAHLDDTLEVVEYVPGRNSSKYVLQPVRKPSHDDDDVVTIDSSTEISYKTARTHLNPMEMSQMNSAAEDEPIDIAEDIFPVKKNRSFFADSFDQCISLTTNHAAPPISNGDIIELSDSDVEDDDDVDMPAKQQRPAEHTLNDVSSIMTDTTQQSDYGSMPGAFNDSLERVEYMMAEGRRILAEKKSSAAATPALAATPTTTKILQQKNTNSPKNTPKDLFKKPTFNSITPGVTKRPPAAASTTASGGFRCRIPKPVSATKSGAGFKHIKSPIGIYVKNRAPTVMVANVMPTKDFFNSSYVGSSSKELDFTILSTSSTEEKQRLPMAISQKAYVCAPGTLVEEIILFYFTYLADFFFV